jgi:hypothetical protein
MPGTADRGERVFVPDPFWISSRLIDGVGTTDSRP